VRGEWSRVLNRPARPSESLVWPLGVVPPNSYLRTMAAKHEDGSGAIVEAKVYKRSRKRARVKVGGVFVTGDKASAAEVKQAVARSTDMLERLGKKIARPGVRLQAARGVPLFSVDPHRPDRLVRKLNGKIERGILENGAFKVLD
jgi:hypothetical protein